LNCETLVINNYAFDDQGNQSDIQDIKTMIINRCIDQLPSKSKQLFELKLQGYTLERIAQIMGLKSSKIAKDKTYKAKNRLINLIKKDQEYKNFSSNCCLRFNLDQIFIFLILLY
jgi:DNA-directed RNA polymerase specialized sigma24 family protein